MLNALPMLSALPTLNTLTIYLRNLECKVFKDP